MPGRVRVVPTEHMTPKQDDDVGDERDIGHHAGDEVIDEHEGRDGQRAVDGGFDAAADGIFAQGRVHFPGLDNVQWRAERVLQNVGQLEGFPVVELAGDLAAARFNGRLDDRRGIELAIEDDGQALVDILAGDFGEALRALGIEA